MPEKQLVSVLPLFYHRDLHRFTRGQRLDASGSRRTCRMAISRNAGSLPDFPEFAQAVTYGVPGTPGS